MQRHVFRLLGGEEVGVQCHLLSQVDVFCRQVGDSSAILLPGLCQVGKRHGHFHGVVCSAGVVPPLMGGLLTFPQVVLRFDEMCLEQCSGLFLLQIGSPGSTVFLEFSRFRDEAVGDVDDLPLCDGLARRGRVINALVQPQAEAFKGLVGIEG